MPESARPLTLGPDEVKGLSFFGDPPAEAKELALRYLGGCVEQN